MKLPEEGVGAEGLLWKVVIDGVAGQDFCSGITSADETRNADASGATTQHCRIRINRAGE